MSSHTTATPDGGTLEVPDTRHRAAAAVGNVTGDAVGDETVGSPETAGAAPRSEGRPLSAGESSAIDVPRVDLVLEGLIYLLIAYLPLAFGGVMPTSQVVIIAASSLIAAVFAVRCISEPAAPVTLTKAFIPLFALVGVVLLQLATLPAGVLELLSPRAAAAWAEVAAARGVEFDGGTLSLYPRGTRADLTVLLAGVILIVVGATIFRRRGAFCRLLAAIALIAFAVATIGLVQILSGADRIYWYFEGSGLNTSGPFAHYGHYSEFLNLGIGCAVGYLLVRTALRTHSSVIDVRAVVAQRQAKFDVERALQFFCVIGAIAIVMSTSRNGLLSMVVGAGVSAALMQGFRRVNGIGWPMVIAAFLALAGLLTLGIDPVIRRFEDTFADPVDAFSTRSDLLRDTASMVAAFPMFGAGLGTYWVSFPAFDTTARPGTAEHAENQYIEVFSELGLVGGLLVFAFVALVIVSMLRSMRDTSHRTSLGLFGVTFAFAAIAFHSLTDFGMEIPAVGLTVALLSGAVLARAAKAPRSTPRVRMATAALSAGTCVALLTGLSPAFDAADAHKASRTAEALRTELRKTGNQGTEQQHQDLLAAATSAADSDPANVEFRFWAAFARWNQAVARARGFDHSAPPATPKTAPELTALARATVDELLEVARLAPTHGPTWAVAGQLRSIWLANETDAPDDRDPSGQASPAADLSGGGGDWILRGRAYAPHNHSICLAAAFEHFRRGDDETALAELNRAIAVGARAGDIVDLLAVDLESPELALPFVDGSLGLTSRLYGRIKGAEEHTDLASSLQESRHALLIAACARPSATPGELGSLARIEQDAGNFDRAKDLYRRLLGQDPVSRLRFDYARLLAADGSDRDARRQLRDFLSYHPGYQPAQRLLAQLESGSSR